MPHSQSPLQAFFHMLQKKKSGPFTTCEKKAGSGDWDPGMRGGNDTIVHNDDITFVCFLASYNLHT